MVAQDKGYSVPKSPRRVRANYAGENLPASKRGEGPTNVDYSFRASPERRMETEAYMSLVHGCALIHPEECQDLKYVMHMHLDGWKMAQVAKDMGVSRHVAKRRIDETLAFLKEFIDEQEQEA